MRKCRTAHLALPRGSPPRSRCSRAQPQGRDARPAPRGPHRVHRAQSGSGKSSLAFDTIFAEGQRRYVESLSSYARQFLGQMDKPDVDFIEGLSPAVSIDQKSTNRNPRSTVGTITEVYDYLRLLFARAGRPHCPVCGEPVGRQTPQQIVDQLLELPEGTRFQVLAPVVRARKGEYADLFAELQTKGFARARVDGDVVPLSTRRSWRRSSSTRSRSWSTGSSPAPSAQRRLTDSVETALAPGRRPAAGRPGRRRPRRPGAGAALLRAHGVPERAPAEHRRDRAPLVLLQLARSAPAPSAPASAPASRSTPTCWCRTTTCRWRRAPSRRGRRGRPSTSRG